MSKDTRNAAKWFADMLVPPIVPKALRRLRGSVRRTPEGSFSFDFRPEWEVIRGGWPAEESQSEGWLDPTIVDTQRRRWPIYSKLILGAGPLGFHLFAPPSPEPVDEAAHNYFMTFGYVLARAAHGRDRLSVLDWGGGIGYYALIAKALLPEVTFDYVVKDVPGLVNLGRELMPEARFESEQENCFARSYDLVLASSSIQYSRDWRSLLSRLAQSADPWLFISRLPTTRTKSFVVVQRPYQYGYKTEFRSWVIKRDDLLGHLADLGLSVEREFLAGGTTRLRKAPDEIRLLGFLCRKHRRRTDLASGGTFPDLGETKRGNA